MTRLEYLWLYLFRHDWFKYLLLLLATAAAWLVASLLWRGFEYVRGVSPNPSQRSERRARFALAAVVIYLLFSTLIFTPYRYATPRPFLFSELRNVWNTWYNLPYHLPRFLYRIATYIPFGALSVLAFPRMRRVWQTSLLSFGLALIIELLQLLLKRGQCAADDILLYVIGGTLGAAISCALLHRQNGEPRLARRALLPLPTFLLACLLYFGSHALLPYGTLPLAPCYRYPMQNIAVSAAIPLADEPMTATVYRFADKATPGVVSQLDKLDPPPIPVAEEVILTPAEVLAALARGDCNWDIGFALPLPRTITVTKLELQYFPDSRGYLQPIWSIHATSEHGQHGFMLPALP